MLRISINSVTCTMTLFPKVRVRDGCATLKTPRIRTRLSNPARAKYKNMIHSQHKPSNLHNSA